MASGARILRNNLARLAAHPMPSTQREQSAALASRGLALIAQALNVTGNQRASYRYSEHACAQFFRMALEITELVKCGEVIPVPPGASAIDPAARASILDARIAAALNGNELEPD